MTEIQSNQEPNHTDNMFASDEQAGGFDKLLLDSLYEDEARRQQIASVTYTGSLGGAGNPFVISDPFAMSSSFAPPSNVQLALMAQQQQQYFQPQQQQYYQLQQQQLMTVPQPNLYHYQQQQYYAPSNPFGDPFSDLVAMAAPKTQGNSSIL
jgi:hypothetical protein